MLAPIPNSQADPYEFKFYSLISCMALEKPFNLVTLDILIYKMGVMLVFFARTKQDPAI